MTAVRDIPPAMSLEVMVSAPDREGTCVAKNRAQNTYLRLAQRESFLLRKLDGKASYEVIAQTFRDQFGEAVTAAEVQDFVTMAEHKGLVAHQSELRAEESSGHAPSERPWLWLFIGRCVAKVKQQSLLYFRVPLCDPDAFLDWLEPKTRWLFSVKFALATLPLGLCAVVTTWNHQDELAGQFQSQFGWSAIVLAFLVTIGVSICHEFGHALACKRYGGEVHEMGVMCLFFMPCLYCNVSDAWLLPSRWQRFLISAAGTYVDFIIWIVAVVIWRITEVSTTVNFMAWVVVATSGLRVLLNLNPLLRLDGYYAMSDLLGQHNLRSRSRKRWMEYVRWVLGGGPRPGPTKDGRLMLVFGVTSWCFTLVFLLRVSRWLQNSVKGLAGIVTGSTFFVYLSKRYFRGILGEDFKIMWESRKPRVFVCSAVAIGILCVPVNDRVGGEFVVKALVRWGVPAPGDGILEMNVDEIGPIDEGRCIGRFRIDDLLYMVNCTQQEIAVLEAEQRRLAKKIREQVKHVDRADNLRERAQFSLDQARISFEAKLAELASHIKTADLNVEHLEKKLERDEGLCAKGANPLCQVEDTSRKLSESRCASDAARAVKQQCEAEGVSQHEAELAERENGLADARSQLAILNTEAEPTAARLNRLHADLNHLEERESRQRIVCPIEGTLITPADKIRSYFRRGEVMFVVADLTKLEVEVRVDEDCVQGLLVGQAVTLKPRSLAGKNLWCKVNRISSTANDPDNLGKGKTVTVYCHLDNQEGALRDEMTGYGRIHLGRRWLGSILFQRGIRLLNPEFRF